MPTPEQIREGLKEIANNWRVLAVLWHCYFGVLALGLTAGIRPSKRVAGILLSLPLLSVGALAWTANNPFNGIVFCLIGGALLALSARLPDARVGWAPLWAVASGALMFSFGWVYPHFLETESFVPYLYAAPLGLIPCPTLSGILGFALALGGLGSRGWSLLLGATGVFYGIFGALWLGVTIDWVLFLGAIVIVAAVITGRAALPEKPG